jgi:hypothetical protein
MAATHVAVMRIILLLAFLCSLFSAIASADDCSPPGCNAYGCWQTGGGCNAYGCWQDGGGCNAYGCWNTPDGSCNAFGCDAHGTCNAYGCP